MTPTEYLTTEFLRYYPDSFITVQFTGDGFIEVTVKDTPASDPDYVWTCEIGSDDDRYIFVTGQYPFREDRTITIPLMPEA